MKNSLEEFCDGLEKQRQRQRMENVDFNKRLPRPDSEYKTEDGHYGYWKVDGGVVCMRKYKNGYAIHDRHYITDAEIDCIVTASNAEGSHEDHTS